MLDNTILSNFGGMQKHSLTHILNPDDQNDDNLQTNMLEHSHYYTHKQFADVCKENDNSLLILSLNTQSIKAKFDQIKIFIKSLENTCKIGAICLQETWLSMGEDLSYLNIENFNFITSGKKCSEHGGLGIYLHKSYKYRELKNPFKSTNFKSQFMVIQNPILKEKTILGNIYRSPNNYVNQLEEFSNEINLVLHTFKNNKQDIVIGGDFNIDLLKINEKHSVSNFLDMIVSNNFLS